MWELIFSEYKWKTKRFVELLQLNSSVLTVKNIYQGFVLRGFFSRLICAAEFPCLRIIQRPVKSAFAASFLLKKNIEKNNSLTLIGRGFFYRKLLNVFENVPESDPDGFSGEKCIVVVFFFKYEHFKLYRYCT